MSFLSGIVGAAVLLFVGMLAAIEAGRHIGVRRRAREGEGAKGIGAVEGAVFALLGLLIAFTFSGAAQRFEDRRHFVNDEVNAFGTAWLRLDALAPSDRAQLQTLFRSLLDVRLEAQKQAGDREVLLEHLHRHDEIQRQIWQQAIVAVRAVDANPSATMLVLPALNEMFDTVATRVVNSGNHPPQIIFVLLAVFSLLSALLAGDGMAGNRGRNQLYSVLFSAAIAITFYVILDLEHPRMGVIQARAVDHILEDLKAGL